MKTNNDQSKVISLSKFRAEGQRAKVKLQHSPNFEELKERNRKNQDRLRDERNKANLSVIKGYELKK